MNILSWGLDFLYKQSASFVEVDLLIGMPNLAKYPIKGAITECKQLFDSDKVKIQAPRYHIMIDRETFTKFELPLVRGLQVEHPSSRRLFEVVLDNKGSYFYNDGEGRKIVLVVNERTNCAS
jgi:hypothetical protein